MASDKIKISAPRSNPHVCYINKEYQQKIIDIRKTTKLSLYALLCTCCGYSLDTTEHIKEAKQALKKQGFKTIGVWAEALLDFLWDNIEDIPFIDLQSIKLTNNKER